MLNDFEPDIHDGPTPGDAFGQALLRYWSTGGSEAVLEYVERDNGFLRASDVGKWFTAWAEMSRLDRWACEQAAGRVLDVGCGAGRHALVVAGHAEEVLGIDSSPGAIEVARARGVRAQLCGVDELPAGLGRFDTILLLGNNIGILGGPGRAEAVLAGLASVAAPNARLIGTSIDPYLSDDHDTSDYRNRNRSRGRLGGQLRMRIRYDRIASPWFDYLFPSVGELRALVAETPWWIEHVEQEGAKYAVTLRLRGKAARPL
ncbi:class I SAM-dependent methyltransferase [Nocardia sp. NPDC088792]|uniref:class I SAM-dependent methyltransferase n=1 Tax=Nocardia sp. NPDC088792 TaxID=3364332 RepID=UPI003804B3FD